MREGYQCSESSVKLKVNVFSGQIIDYSPATNGGSSAPDQVDFLSRFGCSGTDSYTQSCQSSNTFASNVDINSS